MRTAAKAAGLAIATIAGLSAVTGVFSEDQAAVAGSAPSTARVWPDNLYGVDFVDGNTGWISGYAGTVLRTADGGKSWKLTYIGRNELIRRIRFVDPEYGWAVGHRGTIFRSTDGGASWQVQHTEAGLYLRDVDFADRDAGWVVGHDGKILHTTDGGQTWVDQQLSGYQGRDVPRLHGIEAIDGKTAVLVGEFGVIGRTHDSGQTWTLVPNASKTTLLAVREVAGKAIAVGLDGAIFSVALGPNLAPDQPPLTAVQSGTKLSFFDVARGSNGTAVAVGRSILVAIGPGGVRPLASDQALPLRYWWFGGVDIVPDGRVWAAGRLGAVITADKDDGIFRPSFNLGVSANVERLSGRWESSR